MKPGDRIWIGVNVGLVLADDTVWCIDRRGKPLKGNFDEQYLPDSPALPELARWVTAHPQAADDLWHVLDIYGNSAHCEIDKEDTLRSLVAALSAGPETDR